MLVANSVEMSSTDLQEQQLRTDSGPAPNFKRWQKCHEETSETGHKLNKSMLDTPTADQNEDVYIDKYGNILRGQEATVENAFREIEKNYSRRFTIKLKHPGCEDDTHQETGDVSEKESVAHSLNIIQSNDEQDMNSHQTRECCLSPSECITDKCQHQNDLEPDLVERVKDTNVGDVQSSVELVSHDYTLGEQKDINSLMTPSEDVTNECQHQNVLETDMRECNKDGRMDSQASAEVNSDIDEDDSASTDEIFHTPSDQDSAYASNCPFFSDSPVIDLVQEENDSEDEYDSGDENNCEEECIDAHRSLRQKFTMQPNVITKVKEHTASRASSSTEVLKKTSSKVAAKITALSIDRKVVNEKFQIKWSEVSAATADMKRFDTKVQTGRVKNKIEGAKIKIVSVSAKGLSVQAGAPVNTTKKGLTTTAGEVDLTGADVDVRATAEPTALGVSCNTGTATIIGVQEKAKAAAKVTFYAAKVQAGVATATGMKSRITKDSESSAEVSGLDVNVGTAQVTGGELSAVASATASAGTKLSVANFRATGHDGVGVRTSVKASSGLELFHVTAGISGTTGVSLSTTPKVGCVSLTPGIPKLGRGVGFLSFGLGGGIRGEPGTYASAATVKKIQLVIGSWK